MTVKPYREVWTPQSTYSMVRHKTGIDDYVVIHKQSRMGNGQDHLMTCSRDDARTFARELLALTDDTPTPAPADVTGEGTT